MPFLKFNSAIAGHRFAYAPGDVVEWDDKNEAAELCARSIAEEVSQEQAKEATKGRQIRKHIAPKTDPKDQQRYVDPPEYATARPAPERMTTR